MHGNKVDLGELVVDFEDPVVPVEIQVEDRELGVAPVHVLDEELEGEVVVEDVLSREHHGDAQVGGAVLPKHELEAGPDVSVGVFHGLVPYLHEEGRLARGKAEPFELVENEVVEAEGRAVKGDGLARLRELD